MTQPYTLRDISRPGAAATWPSIAAEVQGYLANWLEAANAQVSGQSLELRTTPTAEPGDNESCGWMIAAHLNATTPAGTPVVTLLQSHIRGTTVYQRVGLPEPLELWLGVQWEPASPTSSYYSRTGWVYPNFECREQSGTWSRPPDQHYPFNGVLAWSLEPGAEFFLFFYSQHDDANRQVMPLFIAREQNSGHWLLAASIGRAWRMICWSSRAQRIAASDKVLHYSAVTHDALTPAAAGGTPYITLQTPAELQVSTPATWFMANLYANSTNENTWPQAPACHFDAIVLPPAFASVSISAALSTQEDSASNLWLNLGNNLALRLR